MTAIQPLAVLSGLTAAATGAVSRVANGGNAFLQALVGGEKPSTPPIDPAEQEAKLKLKLQEFGDRIRERLKGAGIDLTQPIELEVSPTGGIQIVGEHPDMVRIEAVLNELPGAGVELAQLLDQGSATSLAVTEKNATLTPYSDRTGFDAP